ncbi:hypothetical protein [Runella zeae]|uniref:hypothetical protein n=1 Tax=Runella zeae TaxID=94255 RepID=UPI0003FEDA98|nr:hypothetical protein [Runella zeae]
MMQHPPRLLTPSLLVLQFLVIVGVVWLKLRANASYFITPDSQYYLQAAHNLLKGKGYVIDFEGKETFCAIWPVGYACCIAGVSWLTTFPLEIASKCVNLAAVGGCFWLIYRRFSDKAWFVGLGLMSSSFIQLYTNTWSEALFIFFVLGFAFSFEKKNQIQISAHELEWMVWLIGAFLVRYAAVFLFIPLIWYKKWRVVLFYSLFIGIYLSYNFYHTHTFTGGHGFWPEEAFLSRIVRGLSGVGEEVLFFALRDWDLKTIVSNSPLKWVIYGVVLAQLALVGVVLWKLFFIEKDKPKKHFSGKIVLEIAFAYLFFTIIIYLTDESIESLYFRRLVPFSALSVVAGLGWVSSQKAIFEQTKWYFVVFFVLSVVHAIPKSY